MPRAKIEYTHEFPYHIYARSNNKDWFYISQEELWIIFLDYFNYYNKMYGFVVHSFVLMNNHYHLIASCSEEYPLNFIMQRLQMGISKTVNKIQKRTNHFWGGPYKASIILEEKYYSVCTKYVIRNPVEANICERIEGYKYTRSHLLEKQDDLTMSSHTLGKGIMFEEDIPSWLNKSYSYKQNEKIRKGLRRRKFNWRSRDRKHEL